MASPTKYYIETGYESSSSSDSSSSGLEIKYRGRKFKKMDRNDGIIRWSPNPSRDEFLHINFNQRILQVYTATGHAKAAQFDFEKASKHNDFAHLNTYDWSPVSRGLVAIGTSHGAVQLLRVDDDSNASITLPLKLQRSCQTVAFNTTGLLAVGLDRVRNDPCLQIWDVNQRLADWDSKTPGIANSSTSLEPVNRLEASVSITSVRFFEDQPQTLVAGIKNQCVRIHDLRDPNSAVINFTTRCNNNLAIDYVEPHYFASSSLDQPGFVIWDRRATARSVCSGMYLEAIDEDGIPWGSVLNKKTAIQSEKNVSIKQLRFSRERGGALGVLSTAGELQVYQTRKEFIDPESQDVVKSSPLLLEVEKTYVLDYPHFDINHKTRPEDRIISFDWMNVGTAQLEARVIALRANGKFEVLEMPPPSAGHLSQFVPWQPPHRIGDPYMSLMKFKDPAEQEANLGPLFASAIMASVPIYGPESFKNPEVAAGLRAALKKAIHEGRDPVVDVDDPGNDETTAPASGEAELAALENLQIGDKSKVEKGKSVAVQPKFLSSKEQHDLDHYGAIRNLPGTKQQHEKLDNVMLQRAKDGYLFDCKKNQALVHQDPWLQDTWEWVQSAEEAAADDGMVSGPLDLGYLGVFTLWNNLLGEKAESRLVGSTVIPDSSQWERLISSINKRAGYPQFEGVETSKPHHRALCLGISGLAKSSTEFDELLRSIISEDRHTCAAALALFEGANQLAVEILRDGGGELFFVAMALDMKIKAMFALDSSTMNTGNWGKSIERYVDKAKDAYLYAIYNFITTGDWTTIAEMNTLPLRSRVGVALRHFDDDKLSGWLEKEMEAAIIHGDIEGIVLAGITDTMADVFAKYIEKFLDYQSPILIMSFCYPRYINDIRCNAWRKEYQSFLNRHKEFVQRALFDVASTKKSRDRAGIQVIKPPPRQITIRCLNCDSQIANDLSNSGSGAAATTSSAPIPETRNPLQAAGINQGLCCPRCGAHLPRCAICMEFVGVPRSDKPELSTDPMVRRLAYFPSFCLKCKHVQHADHASQWFDRHVECPVPECKCQCNETAMWDRGMDT